MDIDVAERTQAAHAPALRKDPSDRGAGELERRPLPRPDQWRWTTDPVEVDPPARTERRRWLSDTAIMALSWPGLH